MTNRKELPDVIHDALGQLHLPGMQQEYRYQIENLSVKGELSFDERMQELVTTELTRRENNRLKKFLSEAHPFNPTACVENVDVLPQRKMNMELFRSLATCRFIEEKRNVTFVGAAGSGKTYLASALVNAACRKGYRSCCVRLPDLLNDLRFARMQGTASKARDAFKKYRLLAIDEWLSVPITFDFSVELWDIVDSLRGKCSLIFCTQYTTSEWYRRIDVNRAEGTNSALTESVLDRILYNMDTLSI
ncbi:MAG: ATP-binding protein, partial [Spirochaetales bacterium]|nr:ATP-binding protein [Spirochaetales bacterium]